jgi:PST family polysaccharide transporter
MSSERKAFLWSVLNALGTRGAAFLFFLVLGRLLGPTVFGIMALCYSIAMLVELLAEHGFGVVVIQEEALSGDDLSTVFWFQMMIAVIGAVTVLLIAPWLAGFFKEPDLKQALPWMVIGYLLNASGFTIQAVMKRALRFRAVALRNFLATIAGGSVGLGMALYGYGLESLVAMSLVNAAMGAAVLWLATEWRPKFHFSLARLSVMYRPAKNIVSVQFMEAFISRADQFVIGYLFGATSLGFYAFAIRLYEVLTLVSTYAIGDAAFPVLSRLQGDMPKYRQALLRIVALGAGVTVPLYLMVVATSPLLIQLVFGEQWLPATAYTNWILFAGALGSVGLYHGLTFNALGKSNYRLRFTIGSILLWGLLLPLILLLGPIFVAVNWAIRQLIMFPPQAYVLLRLTGLNWREYFVPILKVGVAAALMMLTVTPIIYLLDGWVVGRLMLSLLLGSAVYLGALHWIGSPLPALMVKMMKERSLGQH